MGGLLMPVGVPFAASAFHFSAQGVISVATFSSLPSAASSPNVVARVADVGASGSMWYSDGTTWRPIGFIPLVSLSFGESGLVLAPNTAETWISPEITIPGGVIRPRDVVREISFVEFTGTLDSGYRILRTRAEAGTVTTSSATLAQSTTTSTSSVFWQADKANFIMSNTLKRSPASGYVSAGAGTMAPISQTIPNVGSDFNIRVSAQNSSATATMVIYDYVLWLEHGGL